MSSLYKDKKQAALDKLLELAEGKKVHIANELGVSFQTVQMWFLRGQISRVAAQTVMKHEYFKSHFTLSELRPDIKWETK